MKKLFKQQEDKIKSGEITHMEPDAFDKFKK